MTGWSITFLSASYKKVVARILGKITLTRLNSYGEEKIASATSSKNVCIFKSMKSQKQNLQFSIKSPQH